MDSHSTSGAAHAHEHHELPFIRKYIFSEDHKIIGIQFLFSGIIFLGLGGLLALLVRIQLAWPHYEIPLIHSHFTDNGGRMHEQFYNMLFTHARLGDDLLRHHPVPDRRVRQLHHPADDRGAPTWRFRS